MPVLLACGVVAELEKVKDTIEGLTNPMVVEVIVLGLEEPEHEGLAAALEAGEVELGTSVAVFVADSDSSEEVNENTIDDATVEVETDDATLAAAHDAATGAYLVEPGDGAVYTAGSTWHIRVEQGDAVAELNGELPESLEVTVPEEHEPATDLVLNLNGSDHDSALAMVVDLNGEVTWTNQPETAEDYLSWLLDETPLTTLTIPAEAFPDPSFYVVGLAGLKHSKGADHVSGANSLLSAMMAGKMHFYPVTTTPAVLGIGQIVGAETSANPTIQAAIDAAGVSTSTSASLFLADALAATSELEETALPGATVTVQGDAEVNAADQGDGFYTVETGLEYAPGEVWSFDIAHDLLADGGSMSQELPLPVDLAVSPTHTAGSAMTLDFTGLDVYTSLVVVVNTAGDITYSNEPEGAEELYERMVDAVPLETTEVPGTAFPSMGYYVVGVTGLTPASDEDLVGLNQEFSAMMAGQMRFWLVEVAP